MDSVLMKLIARGQNLDLGTRIGIVGVLNVTPDSFYSTSRVCVPEEIVQRAHTFLTSGVDILEVGGESTGPGSSDVSVEEELRRVVSVVSSLRRAFPDAWIAIDTWKATVAEACFVAGADIINDVTGGRGDPSILDVVAKHQGGIVLMFAKDSSPRTTTDLVEYEDVVRTVHDALTERVRAAHQAGIAQEGIIVDPGLGHFVSSDPSYSFEILSRLSEFSGLAPVMVSPSRKSFLAGPSGLPPSERLWPTVAASALAALCGASFIRTHDCETIRSALELVRFLPRNSG